MKRVKAACILQTLVFSQKPEMGYSKESALKTNQEEIERYKKNLDDNDYFASHPEIERYKKNLERTRTKYQIVDTVEQSDGSVILRVRKQYNDRTDVSEYFA